MAPPLAREVRFRLNQLAPALRWQVNLALPDDQPPPVFATGAHVDQLQRATNVQPFNFSNLLLHGSQTLRLLPGLPEGEAALTGAGVPPPAPAPAPRSVDWRVRWGGHWLCTVQNQNPCSNCWAFAAVALIETMIRIEHNIWSKRSEGDLRTGWGLKCANSASVTDALEWAKNNGVADLDCFAWSVADTAYTPTSDRSGRTARALNWQHVGSVSDQKTWLDQVGPLIACFDCFDDFFAYGSGVYRKTANAKSVGAHCVLIVGFDDEQGAWIIRNSWGTGWGGLGGYCLFAYGECQIDFYAKQGIKRTNPDPWVKRRLHNGCVIMSGNGSLHKNFELVRATPGLPWIRHVWRDADLSWKAAPSIFSGSIIGGLQIAASDAGRACVGHPCITASTYNRNFEVVYREASGNLNSWAMEQTNKKWVNMGRFGDGDVAGFPSLIQSSFGAPGNFEVIVMTKRNTLQHWWRGGAPEFKWAKGYTFATNILMSGPSLVQTNIGTPGHFYLLAVTTTGHLQMWWRNNNDLTTPWIPGELFANNISATPPVMIQASFFAANETEQGNFEAFVQIGGRVQHWWRDNSVLRTENPVSNGNTRWHPGFAFGHDVKHVWGAMQGDAGTNMEVFVERTDGRLQQYYRGREQWFEGAIIDV